MFQARRVVAVALCASGLVALGLLVGGIGKYEQPVVAPETASASSEVHTTCVLYWPKGVGMVTTGKGVVTKIVLNPGSRIRLYDLAEPLELDNVEKDKIGVMIRHNADCIGNFTHSDPTGTPVTLAIEIPFKNGLFVMQTGDAVTIQHR